MILVYMDNVVKIVQCEIPQLKSFADDQCSYT